MKKIILFVAVILSAGCVCMPRSRYIHEMKLNKMYGRLEVMEERHKLSQSEGMKRTVFGEKIYQECLKKYEADKQAFAEAVKEFEMKQADIDAAVERVIHKRLWELLLNKTEKLNKEELDKMRR